MDYYFCCTKCNYVQDRPGICQKCGYSWQDEVLREIRTQHEEIIKLLKEIKTVVREK